MGTQTSRFGRRDSSALGATLVEVLVALAAALIIFGVVLEIYRTTSEASMRSVRREGVWADARQLAHRLDSDLRSYASPDQLAYSDSPRTELFKDDRAELFCVDPAPGAGIWKLTVQYLEAGANSEEGRRIEVRRTPVGASGAAPVEWVFGDDETDVRLALRYAYAFNGLEPVWAETARPGARPLLVEYDVTAQDIRDPVLRARVIGAVALSR